MTVSSSFQAFSLTAVRLSLTERPATAATAAPGVATTAEPDRISLSPEARAEAGTGETVPVDGAAPETGPPVPADPRPSTRAERRAEALFAALDADKDGSITDQEFTEGALALLRRAGDRHRVRHGGDRESRGVRRLERTLEKAFGRVDANDDGAIDKNELTAALSRGAHRRGGANAPPPPEPSPAEQPAQPSGASVTSFSVTFVAVAVQRYTALQPPPAHPADTTTETAARAA